MFKNQVLFYAALAGVAIIAATWVTKNAGEVGASIGGAAVDAVDGVLNGTVTGIGEMIGVDKTNKTECEKAKADGRTWDASFACPAGDFLKYVFK